MIQKFVPIALLLFLSCRLFSQASTFDTGNESWRASGDPTSTIPAWQATGGNPGGYIRVTDAAIGGVWYFVASNRYSGNKCDAYGKYLRWDQFTSDTTNQFAPTGNPDVVLESSNMTLVFDHSQNPGLSWTHYDVLLQEDAGWRIGNVGGPAPTQAEFRQVLANISAIRIHGEYRSQADFGGLDNFVLESAFRFDLDGDNSSGATDDGFASDTLCNPPAPVVDKDAVLFSEKPVDSIVVRIALVHSPALESLSAGALPATLSLQQNAPGWLTLVNTGSASMADFITALRTVRYADGSANPPPGERLVTLRAFTECGEMALRYAYLPIFPTGNAGAGTDTVLCAGTPAVNLFTLLSNNPATGGYWSPALLKGPGLFQPGLDAPGAYAYVIPGAQGCPGDTALVRIAVEQVFVLPGDTTLCAGDTLLLDSPPGLVSWYWNDGSQSPALAIAGSGTYTLTGQTAHCTFADSVVVGLYTCEECPVFAPNAFSPNDDGQNDRWQVFLPCAWQRFHLQVFDRWGNLMFEATDPDQTWDGYWHGKAVGPGVCVWRLEWEGEWYGKQQTHRESGDVLLIR